jgi:hypothetical protein
LPHERKRKSKAEGSYHSENMHMQESPGHQMGEAAE